jgi:uncharacterized SAM-binding protein YcdF (DUF218 family)
MFWLEKIVARFLFPLPLSTGFIITGVLMLCFTRRRRAGRRLVVAGTVLLLLFSWPLTARVLLRPLETRYAHCLNPAAALEARGRKAEDIVPAEIPPVWIVVLGTGYHPEPRLPVPSRVSGRFLARFLEGARVQRALPPARLLVSIPGEAASDREKRVFLDELASLTGLPPSALELLERSRNTREEAMAAAAVVGAQPCFLVTDATHMPRAMLLFKAVGADPIAAPVGYTTGEHPFTDLDAVSFIPSAGGLGSTERAVYEYLGLLRESLRR